MKTTEGMADVETCGTLRERQDIALRHLIHGLRTVDPKTEPYSAYALARAAAQSLERLKLERDEAEAAYEAAISD